jgi:hypothetical protein
VLLRHRYASAVGVERGESPGGNPHVEERIDLREGLNELRRTGRWKPSDSKLWLEGVPVGLEQ